MRRAAIALLLLSCAAPPPSAKSAGAGERAAAGAPEPPAADESAALPASGADSSTAAGNAGSAPGNAAASPAASPAPAGTPPAANAADDAELDKDIAAIEQMAGLGPQDPNAAPKGREIVYRVRSGELLVEVGGLTLKPRAKAIKNENGSYAVELEVVAESKDGQPYRIASPSKRPLSIAGEIAGRSGESQRFADERKGSGELLVAPGETRRFRQSWPARGQPKLWWGQNLVLEVGLWGVSGSDDRELPIRRLCTVKLSAGNKPQALVVPPDVSPEE